MIRIFKVIVILAIIISLILLLMYISSNILQISHYNIESNKIPHSFNNLKILQISDLHSKSFGNKNDYLIKKINSQNPDIIVMTGDMINTTDRNFKTFLNLASELSSKYKVYYTLGNHEEHLTYGRKKKLLNSVKETGLNHLDNKKIVLTNGEDFINLYGLRFDRKYYKRKNIFNVEENESLLGKLDKDNFNILLAHNPLYFNVYSKWGADLTLSGHVHGGLIRLPLLGGLISPERKLFPKFYAGKYKIDNKKLIVNRGLGNTKIKIRLFNRPEICVINLKKSV